MFNIHLLPASFGDSILIAYGNDEPHYVLVDGGPYFVYEEIVDAIKKVAPGLKQLELLVVTHIDIDHIDGIVRMLNAAQLPFEVKEIWFNGWNEIQKVNDTLGARQGEYLSHLINSRNIAHNIAFHRRAVVISDHRKLPVIELPGGLILTLLSPQPEGLMALAKVWKEEVEEKIGDLSKVDDMLKKDKRYKDILGGKKPESIEELQQLAVTADSSAANQSSIAFVADFNGLRCLFAADATTEVLLRSIDTLTEGGKLKLDAWKLAHHGSSGSTLESLMKRITCKKILVSSDGKRYQHPHPETIAKLLKYNGPGLTFYFNYSTTYNQKWADSRLQSKYGFSAVYGDCGLLSLTL